MNFVGGIRGLGELKKRVDSGEMKAGIGPLSRFHEAADGHRRYGQHHASQDNLV